MDYERAQQIIRSEETIEVRHRGRPVWIKSLNPANQSASVSVGEEDYIVPVADLLEG